MAAADPSFEAFFDLVPTGAVFYTPVFESGELVDFRFVRLNPAGQRLLGFPAQPPRTFREYFPQSVAAGVFAWHRAAYLTDQAEPFDFPYADDGVDTYFRLVARRSGDMLLVNFTDMADLPRAGVEQALRDSQAREQAAHAEAETQRQRFYDLLMQLPAQVAVHEGPDQVFTLVNPGYQRLAPGRELHGQPIREAWPELVSQGILDVLDHVYQTGEPFIGKELPFQVDFTRTGTFEPVYFNAFFLPLRDAQGQVHGVLDFSYDVTEQVLARQQLQQFNQDAQAARAEAERERAQLQALLAQAPVAIGLFTGDDLHVAAANADMAAMWGYLPAQVVGRPLLEGVPELHGQGFDDLLRQVLHTQVPVSGRETPAQLLRDGQLQTTYYNFVYQPLYDANGQVLGVIDVAVDVTEQVLARQQLERLNQELEARVQERTRDAQQARLLAERERNLLQAVLTQAPVAIGFFQGEELRITAANALLATMWGRTAEQVVGQPFMDAVPELRGQGFEEQMRQVMHTQIPVRGIETPATMLRDGRLQTTYYDFVYQPLYDSEGHLLGVIDVAVEVTEQVLARQQVQALNEALTATNGELSDSNRQLTRSNVDLDTFVYTASHDLKAPITNIESIVLALRDTLPAQVQQDELVAHLLDLLNQTVTRFRFTIEQLTDISRLQLTHAGPAEPVVLARVIDDIRLDLVTELKQADAQLTVDVAPGLVVSFSPSNLRSIVYNLLSNAIKYRASTRPCQVRIHAEPTVAGVVLTVQDNGLGMSDVQQRQLFGLFQRLHTHVEGTGVGLYITKRLVENAGGTITVQSQPDAGTTFTVTFPA